jgi:hypothetical protein
MKEYRLAAWPELAPPFHRTGYRRILSDMSQRFVSLSQLAACSGLKRQDVRAFLELLDARGVLIERERAADDSLFGSLRPLGGWIKRAMSTTTH